jgi:hypothetical protein
VPVLPPLPSHGSASRAREPCTSKACLPTVDLSPLICPPNPLNPQHYVFLVHGLVMDILTCSVGIPSAVWAFPATSGNAHVTPQQRGNSQPLLGMPMSRLSSRGIPSHHWECPCHASAVWEFPATTGNAHVTPQQCGNSQPPLGMPMSHLSNGGIPSHH